MWLVLTIFNKGFIFYSTRKSIAFFYFLKAWVKVKGLSEGKRKGRGRGREWSLESTVARRSKTPDKETVSGTDWVGMLKPGQALIRLNLNTLPSSFIWGNRNYWNQKKANWTGEESTWYTCCISFFGNLMLHLQDRLISLNQKENLTILGEILWWLVCLMISDLKSEIDVLDFALTLLIDNIV